MAAEITSDPKRIAAIALFALIFATSGFFNTFDISSGKIIHQPFINFQSGKVTVTIPFGGFSGAASVTFPRPYSVIPQVVLSFTDDNSVDPGNKLASVWNPALLNGNGFNVNVQTTTSAGVGGFPVIVQWIAFNPS